MKWFRIVEYAMAIVVIAFCLFMGGVFGYGAITSAVTGVLGWIELILLIGSLFGLAAYFLYSLITQLKKDKRGA